MSRGLRISPRLLRRRRALSLWLLALFVLGQTYSVAHHALVDHHVCAESGKLVHGGHVHSAHGHHCHSDGPTTHEDSEHLHASSLERRAESEFPSGPVASSDEGVEHGGFCRIPRPGELRKFVPPGSPLGFERPAAAAIVDVLRSQTFECRIALFRLAPKHPPPLVLA